MPDSYLTMRGQTVMKKAISIVCNLAGTILMVLALGILALMVIPAESTVGEMVYTVPILAKAAPMVQGAVFWIVMILMAAGAAVLWLTADYMEWKVREPQVGKPQYAIFSKLILSVGVLLIICSVSYIAGVLWEYHEGRAEYDALRKEIFMEEDNEPGKKPVVRPGQPGRNEEQDEEEENEKAEDNWEERKSSICYSLKGLRTKYSDVVGWIDFDNLAISYPIVQSEDNNDYLRTTYSGRSNSAGSIILEALNSADFNDRHTIIYGHNMKNGTMFGLLGRYRKKDFWEEHKYFTIYTPEKVMRYEVFAAYDIDEDGFIYRIAFDSDEDFGSLLDRMFRSSYYDTGVYASSANEVVTLSTCAVEGQRFIVNAKCIYEEKIN